MEPDSFLLSKFGQPGTMKVPLQRIGPLRAFQRLCVQVYKLLENYKERLEKNQIVPEVDASPQRANMMSLDGLKLPHRNDLRDQARKAIEKDDLRMPRGEIDKMFQSAMEPQHKPTNPGNINKQLDSVPNTKELKNLSIFSHSESNTTQDFRKKHAKKANWAIPFQLNKPVFPEVDLKREEKYKNRDPREELKYFSLDEESSFASREATKLQFRPSDNRHKSILGRQGEFALSNPQMRPAISTTSLPQVHMRPDGPVKLPGDERDAMVRMMQESAERNYNLRTVNLRKVDDVYAHLLKSNKI
jgi:hypothetical protein